MKKSNFYVALLAGIFGILTLSPKLAATQCAMPGCCGGAVTQSMADEAKPKPDLLTTCPVSGDKIGGDMGKPYVFIYKDQEVKLCCPMCKKEFDKNPEKFIAKIRAADKTDKPADQAK